MAPLNAKPTDLILLSSHAASSLDELVGRKPHAMGYVKYLEVRAFECMKLRGMHSNACC